MRLALCLVPLLLPAQAPPPAAVYRPTPEERVAIERKAGELDAALRPLRTKTPDDLLVDAEAYLKAARWILRYDEFYSKAYVAQTLAVLDTGLSRVRALASGAPAWTKQTGSFCRAYRSRVDGSVQPYAVTVPENTFHESDFRGTNALLFPRAGDWAVTDIRTGEVVPEGVFDGNWQLR